MTDPAAWRDRVAGVLLGTAVGDALGAGYEFGPPIPPARPVGMVGGGSFDWEPGEWTDDTSMAIVIADGFARGADGCAGAGTRAGTRAGAGARVDGGAGARDVCTLEVLDRIASGWAAWAMTAKDVGVHTRAVLGDARRAARAAGRVSVTARYPAAEAASGSVAAGGVTASDLRLAARQEHERRGRSGGNGSLMRTAPVALAFLRDDHGLVDAAVNISSLTHVDPEAGEACALWCLAIRHALRTGEADVRIGLGALPGERAAAWSARIDEAESHTPDHFSNNGWVVQALQGAWSAIATTAPPGEGHLARALEAAVRGGRDTDTVAAIAGGLVGAAYGASAIPEDWRDVLHGWPGRRADDLVHLAWRVAGT